jgi:hypothetical protein
MSELHIQSIRFTLTSLFVGTKNGNVYSFEVADMKNPDLDTSRSLYAKSPSADPEYSLM